jgi:predicted flap endonuclease-1-like 5' DNA nuclease
MMASIVNIEKVGPANAEKLRIAGIQTVEKLLAMCATPEGRKRVADQCAVSEHGILEWVNRADLHRIHGIGEEYADLLEVAGVDTVVELAQRNPENLYQKLVEVNSATARVRRLPTAAQVADWVRHANLLPRVVTY